MDSVHPIREMIQAPIKSRLFWNCREGAEACGSCSTCTKLFRFVAPESRSKHERDCFNLVIRHSHGESLIPVPAPKVLNGKDSYTLCVEPFLIDVFRVLAKFRP